MNLLTRNSFVIVAKSFYVVTEIENRFKVLGHEVKMETLTLTVSVNEFYGRRWAEGRKKKKADPF